MQDNTVNFSQSIKENAVDICIAYWDFHILKINGNGSKHIKFKHKVKDICSTFGFKNQAEVSRFLSAYFEPFWIHKCKNCDEKLIIKNRSELFLSQGKPSNCKCTKPSVKIETSRDKPGFFEPEIKKDNVIEFNQSLISGAFVHAEIIKNDTIGHGKHWIKLTEIKVVAPLQDNTCSFSLYEDAHYFVKMSHLKLIENINKILSKLNLS